MFGSGNWAALRLGSSPRAALAARTRPSILEHHGIGRETLFRGLNESYPAIHVRIGESIPRVIADRPSGHH